MLLLVQEDELLLLEEEQMALRVQEGRVVLLCQEAGEDLHGLAEAADHHDQEGQAALLFLVEVVELPYLEGVVDLLFLEVLVVILFQEEVEVHLFQAVLEELLYQVVLEGLLYLEAQEGLLFLEEEAELRGQVVQEVLLCQLLEAMVHHDQVAVEHPFQLLEVVVLLWQLMVAGVLLLQL